MNKEEKRRHIGRNITETNSWEDHQLPLVNRAEGYVSRVRYNINPQANYSENIDEPYREDPAFSRLLEIGKEASRIYQQARCYPYGLERSYRYINQIISAFKGKFVERSLKKEEYTSLVDGTHQVFEVLDEALEGLRTRKFLERGETERPRIIFDYVGLPKRVLDKFDIVLTGI